MFWAFLEVGWFGTVYNIRDLIEGICERRDDIIVMNLQIHTDFYEFLGMEVSD